VTWNFDWIGSHLAVGGKLCTGGEPVLAREHGVRAVVDLRDETCDDRRALAASGIAFLHLPTPDLMPVSQAMLDDGVGWTLGAVGRGDRVLIHCEHGIGRSAMLAACVLVAGGAEPIEAVRSLKQARAVVSPSPRQLEGLLGWLEHHGHPVPRFDELTAIVYAR
jgi:protein-tyrosine phosphatase